MRHRRVWFIPVLALLLGSAATFVFAEDEDGKPDPAEEEAWQRVTDAADALRAHRTGEDRSHTRNDVMRELADAAAAFLAQGTEDVSRARTAARHVSNYFRILEDWHGALEVWTDALQRYEQPSLRTTFHDGRGRAYVALGNLDEAHAEAQALRELAEAYEPVRLSAHALAIDLDAAALAAATEPNLAATSRLAAEAAGYLIENVAEPHIHLRVFYTLPRLTATLNQPEWLELTARLAADNAPEGSNLWVLMLQHRGTALVELGRPDEANATIQRLRQGVDLESNTTARRAVATIERALVLAPGTEAPNFELYDVKGEQRFSVEDFRGEIVLLEFWATWCGPCRRVMEDHLQPLHEAYAERGLTILGIGSPTRDTAEAQAAFAKEHGYGWLKLFDEQAEAIRAYHVTGLPTLVLLDREGKVVTHSSGAGAISAIRTYLHDHLGPVEQPSDAD